MFSFFFFSLSYEWGYLPHWLLARIAQRHLTTEHNAWINAQLNSWYGEEGTIVTLSTWHDIIRSKVTQPWHFIDIPFYDESYTGSPATPVYNITSVLSEHFGAGHIHGLSSWSCSFFLRGFSHFVGDLHCPVHSVERFTAVDPNGDVGANTVNVVINGTGGHYTLHAYWDGALGLYTRSPTSMNNATFEGYVDEIISRWPESNFAEELEEKDFMKWSEGVYEIAKVIVYQGLVPQEDGTYLITNEYRESGRVQAERLIALAGYRLARVLSSFAENQLRSPTASPTVSPPVATAAPSDAGKNVETSSMGGRTRMIIAWVIDGILACVIGGYVVSIARKWKGGMELSPIKTLEP